MANKNKEVVKKLEDEHLLECLKEDYDIGKQYYARDHKRMKMLDMTDNCDKWKAIDAHFPPYQVLADTNLVSYVKQNILASLYTTAKSASIIPTSEDDKELCTKLDMYLDNFWDSENVAYKQFQAGERAALLNIGVTQVGWDESYYEGPNGSKGKVVLQNVDPMSFMRDPFADSLDNASWCCRYDRLHKSVILKDKRYKDKFKEWLDKNEQAHSEETLPNYGYAAENVERKGYYNLIRFWVRNPEGGIDEIHTIDFSLVLYKKENIKPSMFPFAILYCNLPGKKPVGVSECAKVFTNDVAYSFMISLWLTAEYKNQRPPKFVSAQSGLNIAAFTKHGSEADRTFVVNQDASKAVHYQQFPPMSNSLPNMLNILQTDVQNVSGVDGKYTGRDTGSIITTGGTEEMLNRVTMIDTPKIVNYENYAKELTKLVLCYTIEFSPKRKFFVKKPNTTEYETVEVDFPNIDKDTLFNYSISISSDLPKNKQRMAAWADMIMEKQMQYRKNGGSVELLTEEEWLMFQDIPQRELMLERMGFERDANAMKEATQVLYQYANAIEQGMSPDEALMATAGTLNKTRKGMPLDDAELAMTQPQMAPDPAIAGMPPMGAEGANPLMM